MDDRRRLIFFFFNKKVFQWSIIYPNEQCDRTFGIYYFFLGNFPNGIKDEANFKGKDICLLIIMLQKKRKIIWERELLE